jgi:hypothetical protein
MPAMAIQQCSRYQGQVAAEETLQDKPRASDFGTAVELVGQSKAEFKHARRLEHDH